MTGPRILVVDDDAGIRDVAASVLRTAGYAVDGSADGVDALTSARASCFDLILLDINMPRMDGWQTLRLLRRDEALGSIPVILFSVKGEVRDRIHALQEGANDYVVKPFEVDDLLGRVGRLVESRGVSREGGEP